MCHRIPCMPPWSNHACPPGATTHAPPRHNHACPPIATMHAPGATTHAPPRSNHARPPWSNHARPPWCKNITLPQTSFAGGKKLKYGRNVASLSIACSGGISTIHGTLFIWHVAWGGDLRLLIQAPTGTVGTDSRAVKRAVNLTRWCNEDLLPEPVEKLYKNVSHLVSKTPK